MQFIERFLRKKDFLRARDGATAIEYGLMLALLAVAVIVSLQLLGIDLAATFSHLADVIGTGNAPSG